MPQWGMVGVAPIRGEATQVHSWCFRGPGAMRDGMADHPGELTFSWGGALTELHSERVDVAPTYYDLASGIIAALTCSHCAAHQGQWGSSDRLDLYVRTDMGSYTVHWSVSPARTSRAHCGGLLMSSLDPAARSGIDSRANARFILPPGAE